jgi:hypothetical protein
MIRRFFGDGERDFALPTKMILELEATTQTGFGDLTRRMASHGYRFKDIAETIRLGLIGGGISTADAARMIATYVEDEGRPLIEAHMLALDILSNRYAGDQPIEQDFK